MLTDVKLRSLVDADEFKHRCSIHWWELQNVSHKQEVDSTKPLVSGKDLVETEENVCQVQTGHHGDFVYDQQPKLGERGTHHLQCLFA